MQTPKAIVPAILNSPHLLFKLHPSDPKPGQSCMKKKEKNNKKRDECIGIMCRFSVSRARPLCSPSPGVDIIAVPTRVSNS
jgi:hypothetical protein